jgi:hypothetical protein
MKAKSLSPFNEIVHAELIVRPLFGDEGRGDERFRFASESSSSFEKKSRMRNRGDEDSPCGKSTVDYIYRVSPVAERVGSQPLLFERRRRLGCTKRSGLSALL